MTTVSTAVTPGKTAFDDLLRPFLQQPGLPFADVLSAQTIEQVFAQRDALFATGAVFSTPLVLWAFLAQVLRDGKGAACAAAVADIATYAQQIGRAVPCGDTGDYCRARAKLNPDALRDLVVHTAGRLQQDARPNWLWHGRHTKLVDGFTFTMLDTSANQAVYPQPKTQAPGVGHPTARAVAVLSLATAAIHDLAIGPYAGKQTGETALLRSLLEGLDAGDVVVTTLTDPVAYPAEDIAELFNYRWNAELDICRIKQTLGLDHVQCKSPAMVQRHLWVTLLGYNLIRGLIATAAAVHDKQPRQLGFTLACQTVLSSWMLEACGVCRDPRGLIDAALRRIAANEVANRPGRIEPRAVKRRPKPHKLLRIPRQQWKRQWHKQHPSCN
jgi:3',5'-cyclic AMP phosphodiesterase CpdA